MLAIAQKREEPHSLPTLIDAVEAGSLQAVRELLNDRADVNAATNNGMTALMCAAKNGHLKILLLLLEAGADVNYVRNDGMTALALAAFFGHLQVVEELINRGAVLDVPGSRNPPEGWAASRGFLDIAYFLKKVRARTPHIREVRSSQAEILLSEAKPQAVESLDSKCSEQIDVADFTSSQFHSIDQPEWLEFSAAPEVSAASIWAADYEKEIPNQSELSEARTHEYLEADDILDGIGMGHETTSSDTEQFDGNSFEQEDYVPVMMAIHESPPSDAKLPDGNSAKREECSPETETIHQTIQVDVAEDYASVAQATSVDQEIMESEIIGADQLIGQSEIIGVDHVTAPNHTKSEHLWELEDNTFVTEPSLPELVPDAISCAPENIKDWNEKQEIPRVRVLDESQVLPSEASFATVLLNQPLESDIPGNQRAEVPDNSHALSPHARVRLLDDSGIPSREAGCGSAHDSDEVIHRGYSPLAEFLVRTNMNFRQLVIATALLISLLLVATLAIQEFTTGSAHLSSHETVNKPVVFAPAKQSSAAQDRVTNNHPEPARIVPEQKQAQTTEKSSNSMRPGRKETRGKNTEGKAVGPKGTLKSERAARAHRVDRRESKNAIAVKNQATAMSSETTAQRTGVSETSITNGSQRPRTVKGYRQKSQE